MRTSGANMPAASAAIISIEDRIFRNKSSKRRLGRRMVFPPSMRLQPVVVAHLRTLRSGGFLFAHIASKLCLQKPSDRQRRPATGLQLGTLDI